VKLVLFDIDGTMITSRGAGRRAMRGALERVFGSAGGIDQYDLGGRTDTRIVHDVVGAMGWERARVQERLDDFFEAYVAGLTSEIGDGRQVVTLPGVSAVVERLAASDEAVLKQIGWPTSNATLLRAVAPTAAVSFPPMDATARPHWKRVISTWKTSATANITTGASQSIGSPSGCQPGGSRLETS